MAIQENASKSPQHNHQAESAESATQEGVGMAAPAFQVQASTADEGGLPPGLKYGVEQESGFDLSAVRVHRGSSLPAKYGALAIAKGLEVHLAPGQEDKLPHEVWHLVQQWRGEVTPTHELGGQPINKNKKLEADATRMGEKASQHEAEQLDRKQLRQPSPQDIVQCLAVQISIADIKPVKEDKDKSLEIESESNVNESKKSEDKIEIEEEVNPATGYRISHVNIVGRPKKAFSNSMGDHTTAFSVHQKGIMIALQGKTIEGAAKHVSGLVSDLDKLPGMKEEVIERVFNRKEELKKLRDSMTLHYDEALKAYNLGSPDAILHLQRLIAEYLEYRELVPFSVMNIASVSMALAGKGKGEAGNSALLEAHETGTKKSEQEDLQSAILNLLDTEGLAILCAESTASSRQSVLPGISEDSTPKAILEMVIKQHLMSIQMSFPKSYIDAGIGDLEKVVTSILPIIAPLVKSRVEYQTDYLAFKRDSHNRKADDFEQGEDFRISARRSKTKENKGEGATKSHKAKLQRVQHDRNLALGFEKQLAYIKELKKEDWIKDAKKTDMKWEDPSLKTSEMDLGGFIKEGDKLAKREEDDLLTEEVKQPHATELEVDNAGKITGFQAGGRTPSPFGSQTMGAHTTAWVVHLDEIRQTIRGKKPDQAIQALNNLSQIYYDKSMMMIDLIQIEKNHEKELVNSFDRLTKFTNSGLVPPFEQYTFLQAYVNALLTFINFIPGATVNKVNTNGHGEGESRRYMLDFEAGKEKDLSRAKKHVANLLDAEGLSDMSYTKEAIAKVRSNHREAISRAYPVYALALVNESTEHPKKKKKVTL